VPAGVALLVFSLFECTLAVLILRGTNWARLTAMSLSSLSIILQVTAFFAGQAAEVPQSDRPAYALDVLILLALSSDRARSYSHAKRDSRNCPSERSNGQFLLSRGKDPS